MSLFLFSKQEFESTLEKTSLVTITIINVTCEFVLWMQFEIDFMNGIPQVVALF